MPQSIDKHSVTIGVVAIVAIVAMIFVNSGSNLVGQAGNPARQNSNLEKCNFVSESDFDSLGITDLSGYTGSEICTKLDSKNSCVLVERSVLSTIFQSTDLSCTGIQSQDSSTYLEPCNMDLGFLIDDKDSRPVCSNTAQEEGEDISYEPMFGDFMTSRTGTILCCRI